MICPANRDRYAEKWWRGSRNLRRLAALQTALGGLNDLSVIEQWARNAASTLPARERRLVAGMCKDYAAARTPVLAKQFADAWRKFARTEPFWK